MSTILVTGGAGFIGSHTCVELLGAGYDIVVLDNFCNSKPEALDRIKKLQERTSNSMKPTCLTLRARKKCSKRIRSMQLSILQVLKQ